MHELEEGYRSQAESLLRLGEMKGVRPRPSYLIGVPDDWQRESYFPSGNRKRLTNGMTLVWRFHSWRKVDGSYDGVKLRMVRAAVFDRAQVACFFEVKQTKNGSDLEFHIDDYAITCDDESQENGEHASAVKLALERLDDGRNWLEEGEAVSELAMLYVAKGHRGTRVWQEAMIEMLSLLAEANGGSQICVLQAQPLELCWRERTMSDQWFLASGNGGQAESKAMQPLEESLAKRRRRAILTLYERELGFEPIVGQWMARRIETPRSNCQA